MWCFIDDLFVSTTSCSNIQGGRNKKLFNNLLVMQRYWIKFWGVFHRNSILISFVIPQAKWYKLYYLCYQINFDLLRGKNIEDDKRHYSSAIANYSTGFRFIYNVATFKLLMNSSEMILFECLKMFNEANLLWTAISLDPRITYMYNMQAYRPHLLLVNSVLHISDIILC